MIAEADAVVIGAGAFGVSAAYHLAKQGLKRIVLVDRFAPGTQSSPRAAGLFKQIQGDETRTRLALLSINKMLSFEADTGVSLDVVCSGSLMLARTPEHARYIEHEAQQSKSWGVNVEVVDKAAARRILPLLEPDELLAVCHTPGDIYIEEPVSLLKAYMAAGEQLGVTILAETAVTEIGLKSGEVQSVITSKGTIETPVVVDAAGGWARAIGEQASANVPVVPVRHQLYITQPVEGVNPLYPIARFIDSAVYIRPARGGLMLGGFESNPIPIDPRQQPSEFSIDDVPLDMKVLDKFNASVNKNVPAFHDATINEHRGGLFTMTSDGRFLVGPASDVRGFWTITGCNGSGFSFSPALGQMLAEWVVEGEPSIDLTSLSPARFSNSLLEEDQLREACIWQYGHYYDPPKL